MSKKITNKEFNEKILTKFDGHVEVQYNSYNGMNSPIAAICNIHNIDISKKTAEQLLNAKYPCSKCHRQAKLDKHIVKFHDAIQGYYQNTPYRPKVITEFKQSIEMWCDEHGWKKTDTETVSFKRYGCQQCARINVGKSRIGEQRVSYETFVQKVYGLFGKELKVVTSKKDFINQQHDVEVTCPNPAHKSYVRPGTQILKSSGCIYCHTSRGELLVRQALDKLGIKYESEKRFPTCFDKNTLPFDFWLPEYGALIEFQGKQHFEPWELSGGEKELKKLKKRDRIKANWAKENELPLLRIESYNNLLEAISKFIDDNEGNASQRTQTLMGGIEAERQRKWKVYKSELDAKHNGRLSFENTYWTFGVRKIKYDCIEGGHKDRFSELYSLLKGHGCAVCAGVEIEDDRVELANNFAQTKNGKCHSTSYINTDKPLIWSCAQEHYWPSSYDSVVKRGSWCPWCAVNHKAFVVKTVNRLIEAGYKEYAQQSFAKYLSTYPQLTKHFKDLGLTKLNISGALNKK